MRRLLRHILPRLLLLAILNSVALTGAAAESSFACQFTASAGLVWDVGHWVPTTFSSLNSFVLEIRDNIITSESAAKPLQVEPSTLNCHYQGGGEYPTSHCADQNGGNLVMSPRTLSGGISKILGGITNNTVPDELHDTPYVATFTCLAI